MGSKLKRLLSIIVLLSIVFAPSSEVHAAEVFIGPQIKVKTILTDRAFLDSFHHMYIGRETKEVKSEGEKIAEYACKFIGNPYVWGGTSLTNGADCSGFVQSVYQHFGIALPRTSYTQRNAGIEVDYENALPGDIICYAGHVGIYIGDGEIVNARSPKEGIGITPAEYDTILAVRRVI